VVFTPLGEDYGFVTAEAFASGKPVITCPDSGGPTDLVTDGGNGLLVAADPAAIAGAMRRLADDSVLCERLGAAAARDAAAMSWPHVVQRLVVV
jgi:glycosyltransferase involved in cell wall biosynthesis